MTAGMEPAPGAVSGAESFEEFYARSVDGAARLGHLITGSAATGLEIAQEAMTVVHRRWDELDSPGAYLRRAVVNSSRSVQRRWFREQSWMRRQRPASVTDIPEFDETWAALCRLPARQREVVALRFYEDLTVDQIADVLEVPAGTVKSTIHRALRNLKELLQ